MDLDYDRQWELLIKHLEVIIEQMKLIQANQLRTTGMLDDVHRMIQNEFEVMDADIPKEFYS